MKHIHWNDFYVLNTIYKKNNKTNNLKPMAKFLKKFTTHTAYESYISGLTEEEVILPNVSYCVDANDVHYNPWVETRLVAKFNVTSTSSAIDIMDSSTTSYFSDIEIDGVVQPSVVSSYTFDTTGEHTVKYTLVDPTTIGNATFWNCNNLISITISDSVTSIGANAFRNCTGLTSIVIPNTVTTLGTTAFAGCTNLTNVTIGNSVTSISQLAFYDCNSLTSITIPDSVTSIGSSAFQSCDGLTSITSLATTAPTISNSTFQGVKTGGTLTVPTGSTGYDVWMGTGNYYLGKYSWTKVEQ